MTHSFYAVGGGVGGGGLLLCNHDIVFSAFVSVYVCLCECACMNGVV